MPTEFQLLCFLIAARRNRTPAEKDFGINVTIDRNGVRRAVGHERRWTVDPDWSRNPGGMIRAVMVIAEEMREHVRHGLL